MATLNPNSAPAGGLLPAGRAAGNANAPSGLLGELGVSEFLPRYHALAKSGFLFSVSSAAVNPAAFIGGAAGTPLFGLYNPANSGKDLIILQSRVAIRNTGSAAINSSLNFWGVNQGGVAVTGTPTAPRNMYSGANTGSIATAMVNTANTAALASTLIAPSISLQATAANADLFAQLIDPVDGAIIVSPGSYLAFGASALLTSGSLDAALLWAELPA